MDPMVVQELTRLQDQKQFGGEGDDDPDDADDADDDGSGSGGRNGSLTRRKRSGLAGGDGEVPSMYRGKMNNRLQRMKQNSREMVPHAHRHTTRVAHAYIP